MTIGIASLHLAATQRSMLSRGITVVHGLDLRGRFLNGNFHSTIGRIISDEENRVRINPFPSPIEHRYRYQTAQTFELYSLLRFSRFFCLFFFFHNYFRSKGAYPFGTAVLNSSSNESTVGLEADMLLGERSIGLESPFIPPEEMRLSTVNAIVISVIEFYNAIVQITIDRNREKI